MEKEVAQQLVYSYIRAYNNFDVNAMLAVLHPGIEFKNMADGEVTLRIDGLSAFENQANNALQYFSERQQTITEMHISDEQTEISIDYVATLAVDLPNGLKAGERLVLKGKSIFRFKDDLIISIEDIS